MSIPSSTVDLARRVSAIGSDPTRTHARALRTLLEQLEDLSNARTELVARVDRMTASDDITQRVARAASAMEQWVNVQPAMFEDILDEELSKYDRFRVQLEENGQKQEAFLQSLQARACCSFFDTTSTHLRVAIVQERHAFVLLRAITACMPLLISTSTEQNGYIVTVPVQPAFKPYVLFCAERVTLRFASTGLGAGGSTIVSHSSESGGGRSSTARGFGLLLCTGGPGGMGASTGTWRGGDSGM